MLFVSRYLFGNPRPEASGLTNHRNLNSVQLGLAYVGPGQLDGGGGVK